MGHSEHKDENNSRTDCVKENIKKAYSLPGRFRFVVSLLKRKKTKNNMRHTCKHLKKQSFKTSYTCNCVQNQGK